MHVSRETPEDTSARLRRVITHAELDELRGLWWWNELPLDGFPVYVRNDAIALVRDGDHWSQLVPVRTPDDPSELLRVWSFHFPAELDNSGFIGWLASELKRATGSGVMVVCGQNAARGGIHDYWAVPDIAGEHALHTVRSLMVAPTAR